MTNAAWKVKIHQSYSFLTAKDSFLLGRYSKYLFIPGVIATTTHKTSELSKVTKAILTQFPLFWIIGAIIAK